ncbi:MAG: N-acetylneuraminate synthase family protein [Bacteroidia bacterium]|nr:N-acetylneuraminate synthase family protein [Bacteroidia bacterium]
MENFKGKHGPLLIAEIGGNHEGNFEYAKKLTKLAISTDVDYIKFQLYSGDGLVNPIESPDRNEHFKKFQLTKEQHIYLAETVLNAGMGYIASVWDEDMMSWIDPYLRIYKVGSGDLTAYPLLHKIAQKYKPIILSTGLATEGDILDSIDYIQEIDEMYKSPENLAVLQCTSMYPIPDSDANLAVIPHLKKITRLTVGYSDHTTGIKALLYAYAMGAEILEFHFTDTREGKTFRDHKISLIPSEIAQLKQEIGYIRTLKGGYQKKPVKSEIENNHVVSFRRAVYPAKDIPKGKIIEPDDLVCLRPNHGIDAREFDRLIGEKTKTDLMKYQRLAWDLFE